MNCEERFEQFPTCLIVLVSASSIMRFQSPTGLQAMLLMLALLINPVIPTHVSSNNTSAPYESRLFIASDISNEPDDTKFSRASCSALTNSGPRASPPGPATGCPTQPVLQKQRSTSTPAAPCCRISPHTFSQIGLSHPPNPYWT